MPKTLAGEPLRVSQNLVTQKFYELEGVGVSRFSVENFLSPSAEKIRRGNPLVFHFISAIEKICIRGGRVSRFSVGNFLSQSRKFP